MSQISPIVRRWLAGPLPRDVAVALDRLARSDDVCHVAVMPDVHLSEEICTGTVVATRRLLYPNAVGNDIGCGMAALRFQGDCGHLADERAAARLLAGLYRTVPAIRHGRATAPLELPCGLADLPLSDGRLEKLKSRDGRVEFATLGRGHADALCSSSHGAGRCLSRAEAFQSIPSKEFYRQMQGIWFDHRLASKLRDEAPSAYKDIQAVIRAQRELTRIVRKLRPILSYKGA